MELFALIDHFHLFITILGRGAMRSSTPKGEKLAKLSCFCQNTAFFIFSPYFLNFNFDSTLSSKRNHDLVVCRYTFANFIILDLS